MQRHKVSYREAFEKIGRDNPELTEQYAFGNASRARAYAKTSGLTPAQRAMAELQADPEKARQLASWCVDHLARQRIVNVGPGVNDPRAAYKEAVKAVRRENPTLAACEQTGFIAGDDFKLLALLIPNIAAEVSKGNYSRCETRCRCGRAG